ncbi:MAG: hypothetical protein WKG07_09515 [Hymenobacter sp.]
MLLLARHGRPLLVHLRAIARTTSDVEKGDTRAYSSYLASRPKSWEDEAH